jgi:hypothetical protein
MYFLYKNEYRICKTVEITLRRGLKIEEMNQLGLLCTFIWKCHNKIPCIAIVNKQNCLFSKRRAGK